MPSVGGREGGRAGMEGGRDGGREAEMEGRQGWREAEVKGGRDGIGHGGYDQKLQKDDQPIKGGFDQYHKLSLSLTQLPSIQIAPHVCTTC